MGFRAFLLAAWSTNCITMGESMRLATQEHSYVKRPSATSDKPVLDEGAFQQLLSAAFVLQQHKDKRQEDGSPESALGQALTQVVEIREQICNRHLDLQAATNLVARRIREITGANGAAVGILDSNDLEYYAATGSAAGELGARAPFESSLAAECLRSGQVLRCPDAETDASLKPELCRPLNIRDLIAVPILFETRVAGVLELHSGQPNSFREQDVHTCQLLAALLAEAIAQDKRVQAGIVSPSKAAGSVQPADNAFIRAALEKIKPELERLAGVSPSVAPSTASFPQAGGDPAEVVCAGCGNLLAEDESFCGVCGTSRPSRNTWASLWDLQREAEKSGKPPGDIAEDASSESLEVLPSELEDIVAQFSMNPEDAKLGKRFQVPSPPASRDKGPGSGNGTGTKTPAPPYPPAAGAPPSSPRFSSPRAHLADESDSSSASFARGTDFPRLEAAAETEGSPANGYLQSPESPWTSAAGARAWLDGAWQTQRANVYLAASAVLLIAVLLGIGIPAPPPNPPQRPAAINKGTHRAVAPQPELSTSDKLLISLGLADPPAPPADNGNPDAKVWIDVHTALYYCAGSDSYGKTGGGRFTTQSDAQQDNFQPASRRACE
jgi:putative methionine-R-sulfoxide reductase with GAF domain